MLFTSDGIKERRSAFHIDRREQRTSSRKQNQDLCTVGAMVFLDIKLELDEDEFEAIYGW